MKILITGINSYIGNSFAKWVNENKLKINIDFISIRDDGYLNLNFSQYEAVIHLAALVHKNENKIPFEDYLKVNVEKTKLLINKAISDKVPHFIFMSTMAVFLLKGKIDEKSQLLPSSKYGKSKLLAENFLKSKKNEIKISIIRAPMIYGKSAPGNPRKIEFLSNKINFFPTFKNKRSFLEINALCVLIYQILSFNVAGIFHPSNPLMSTYDLFSFFRSPLKTYKITFFNPLIRLFMPINSINKIFGDLYYDFRTNPIDI